MFTPGCCLRCFVGVKRQPSSVRLCGGVHICVFKGNALVKIIGSMEKYVSENRVECFRSRVRFVVISQGRHAVHETRETRSFFFGWDPRQGALAFTSQNALPLTWLHGSLRPLYSVTDSVGVVTTNRKL